MRFCAFLFVSCAPLAAWLSKGPKLVKNVVEKVGYFLSDQVLNALHAVVPTEPLNKALTTEFDDAAAKWGIYLNWPEPGFGEDEEPSFPDDLVWPDHYGDVFDEDRFEKDGHGEEEEGDPNDDLFGGTGQWGRH